MKIKKLLSLGLLAGALTMTACGGGGGSEPTQDLSGKYDLLVWVGESAVDLTKKQIANFVTANPTIQITANVVGVSESESATKVLQDIDAGADLYCFAQDQFARLVQGSALAKLGKKKTEAVKKENDAGSVGAVTSGSDLFAYPLTSDNGYFMYYDKSVITNPAHLEDLDLLIADCKAAGKNISFEFETSGWYLASWFFGAGCTSTWTANNKGKFTSVKDDFNSDKGILAAKAAQKLVQSGIHVSSHDVADFGAATPSAVVVDGAWDYNAAVKALGDNLGAAPLPTVKVDGKSFHLGSFSGNKLLGVKPNTDAKKLAVCHELAAYLTGEACQVERFNEIAFGPSNLKAQQLPAVQANPALKALAAQNAYGVPQGQIHGSWWDIATALGASIKAAKTEADLRTALKVYDDAVKACVVAKEAAWGIIGVGGNWSDNIALTKQDDGTFAGTQALAVGDEFKVRDGTDWDSFKALTLTLCDGIVSLGAGENLKCEVAGSYRFVVDGEAQTLVITKA